MTDFTNLAVDLLQRSLERRRHDRGVRVVFPDGGQDVWHFLVHRRGIRRHRSGRRQSGLKARV